MKRFAAATSRTPAQAQAQVQGGSSRGGHGGTDGSDGVGSSPRRSVPQGAARGGNHQPTHGLTGQRTQEWPRGQPPIGPRSWVERQAVPGTTTPSAVPRVLQPTGLAAGEVRVKEEDKEDEDEGSSEEGGVRVKVEED